MRAWPRSRSVLTPPDEGLVPVRNFLGPELKKERRIQALNALGKFLFRLDLFGLSFACYYGDLFKALETGHTVEYCIFRPDLLSFSSSRKARIPVFDSSTLITRFIKEEFLEPSDIVFLREGYQSHRLIQPMEKA